MLSSSSASEQSSPPPCHPTTTFAGDISAPKLTFRFGAAATATPSRTNICSFSFWWSSYRAWNSRSARASIAAWAACFLALSFFGGAVLYVPTTPRLRHHTVST